MINKKTHTNSAIHWIFFDIGSTLVDEEEAYKQMLLVDNVESRELLTALIDAMYDELPAPKKRG